MAEAGIFVGWGQPTRGREKHALDVFNESMQYWGDLQRDGAIEGFDVAILTPHGAELGGYCMLKGTERQIDSLRRDEQFRRWINRVQLIADQVSVVDAFVDQGLARALGDYQHELGHLGV